MVAVVILCEICDYANYTVILMYRTFHARIRNGNQNVTELPEEYIIALDVTTYVGVLFSLIGLVIMLITYLAFR